MGYIMRNGVPYGAGIIPIELTGTLTAGQTSISFTDDSITTEQRYNFYVWDKPNCKPTSVTISNHTLTLTYPAQATDTLIKVVINENVCAQEISNDSVIFDEASTRSNIASGETLKVLFGKIKKFLTDLKAVAFSGSYSDLSDKPTIPTNVSQLSNDSGYITSSGTASNVSGTVAIAHGGTGATDRVNAGKNLFNSTVSASDTLGGIMVATSSWGNTGLISPTNLRNALLLKLRSTTASSLAGATMGSTASRQYCVGLDSSGYLSVNIPWSNSAKLNEAVLLDHTAMTANTDYTLKESIANYKWICIEFNSSSSGYLGETRWLPKSIIAPSASAVNQICFRHYVANAYINIQCGFKANTTFTMYSLTYDSTSTQTNYRLYVRIKGYTIST